MDGVLYLRRLFDFTITYDTPPEKINRAVEILREIISVPEGVNPKIAHSTEALTDSEAIEGEAEHKPHPNGAMNATDWTPWVYFNLNGPGKFKGHAWLDPVCRQPLY